MPPATWRDVAFVPLRDRENDFEDGTDLEREDEAEGDERLGRESGRCQSFSRAAVWAISSATAIYTTKELLTTYGHHYPLTIAASAIGMILFVYIASLRVSAESDSIPSWRKLFTGQCHEKYWISRKWLYMLPASIAAAVSFPMLLEGLLHMPSLPVLVMLFPVIYATESLVLFTCCSSSRSRQCLPWEAVTSAIVSGLVLYFESRLEVLGLIWGVTGLLLMGLARACCIIGAERSGTTSTPQARWNAYHGFVAMSLVLSLVLSIVGAFYFESGQPNDGGATTAEILVRLLNLFAFMCTAITGSSLLVYSPFEYTETKPGFSNIPLRLSELLPTMASGLLVLLLSIHSSPISYVSWTQCLIFFLSAIFLVGSERIHTSLQALLSSITQHLHKSLGSDSENFSTHRPSKYHTTSALFLGIIFTSWFLSFLTTLSISSLPPPQPTHLDTTHHPTPNSTFEIVISMYDEEPTSVHQLLSRILSTPYLTSLSPSPKITIYTKSSLHDLATLRLTTGAHTVTLLPNTGREGGTYLHHIVSHWDTLAPQTLFIQAHAHNMRELIPRLSSYLVPETGFLSLGFSGVSCACGSCGDRWGWEDRFSLVPTLYHQVYNQPCTPSSPILLSYKGQFIASAPRIRGIDRSIYQGLLKTITSESGWSHNSTLLNGEGLGGGAVIGGKGKKKEGDSASNPYFGFSLERAWGLLMQCGTDERVGIRCPSLLSGTAGAGWGTGRGADCGCLDR